MDPNFSDTAVLLRPGRASSDGEIYMQYDQCKANLFLATYNYIV